MRLPHALPLKIDRKSADTGFLMQNPVAMTAKIDFPA